MKDYYSLDNLLKTYKAKMKTDKFVKIDYLCSCGEIHTIIFLYTDQDALDFATNNHMTFIDKDNKFVICHNCGYKTDLFNMYLAIAGKNGYTIQPIDEINLMN